MIFVDSNIVIDLADAGSEWRSWSRKQLATDVDLVTNEIVLAETAPRFQSLEQALAVFADLSIALLPFDARAAFRAGQAHAAYRRAGGPRTAILADFLIGAHAVTLGATLLTRDRARFAAYFPELPLLTPETD